METYSPMGVKLRLTLNTNDGVAEVVKVGLIMIVYLNIEEF